MKPNRLLPLSVCLVAVAISASPLTFFTRERQNLAIAAELKTIEQRGYLVVAVKDNLRPLGFRDASGNLQGLEIEIARQLASELLGNPDAVRLQPVTNQERIDAVLEHQVDLTIARLTVTGSRSRLVSFSTPYYIDGTAFITRQPGMQQLSDVAKQKIAVLEGSSTIAHVKYFIPNAQLVGVSSYQAARSLLESGEAATFAADASVLTGWAQEYPEYRVLPFLISAEALSIVMPKGLQYDPLRRKVNEAIARWRASGWLEERAKFWGLPLPQ